MQIKIQDNPDHVISLETSSRETKDITQLFYFLCSITWNIAYKLNFMCKIGGVSL